MKKANKLSLTETIMQMPANGTSMLPDGKSDMLPAAVDFSMANKMRSQVPTQAAAMAGAALHGDDLVHGVAGNHPVCPTG